MDSEVNDDGDTQRLLKDKQVKAKFLKGAKGPGLTQKVIMDLSTLPRRGGGASEAPPSVNGVCS